jgi:hypothetical protein
MSNTRKPTMKIHPSVDIAFDGNGGRSLPPGLEAPRVEA